MDDVLEPTAAALQRLVSALVAEAHRAEDVAQEAWLSAVRKRISEPELGRWLGGAARRIAHSMRRDDARRREREERAPRRTESPSALDTVARLELVKRVVGAVEELDEPFRTAVVLFYFEELPPRVIARRMDVPVNTARSRVRRGLERLRERLDPAGLLALLPLSSIDRTAASAGHASASTLVSSKALLLGGTAVLIAGGVFLSRGIVEHPAGVGARSPRSTELVESAPGAAEAALHDGRDPGASQRNALAPGSASASRTDDAQRHESAALVQDGLAEIRGRFLLEDGRAVAGVPLVLRADTYSPDRIAAAGLGADEGADAPEPSTTTDSEGSFALQFEPLAGVGSTLDLELEGYARASWTWFVEPGQHIDLGTVRLERGAAIEGRVLDSRGQPVAQVEWQVSARMESESSEPDAPYAAEHALDAHTDPLDGTYRIAGLARGTYVLEAYTPAVGFIAGPTIELAGPSAVQADIVYDGPDPARRVLLRALVHGFPRLQPAREHVRLLAPGGEPRAPESAGGGFAFDGLAPGAYTLEIDDPRFLPWSAEVSPGNGMQVELRGSASLVLHAFDQETRAEVERFAVRMESLEGIPARGLRLHDGREPLEDGLLTGIVPGDFTLLVSAEGYGFEAVDVLGLAPGETRALTLWIGPGSSVAGRVRHADGTSAAGVEVSCLAPAPREDSPQSPILRLGTDAIGAGVQRFRRELARVPADAGGAFHFDLPRPGNYVLAVIQARASDTVSILVSAGEDSGVEGLELVVP